MGFDLLSGYYKTSPPMFVMTSSDDDLYLFIDNRLVMDVGGVHRRADRYLNLDTIGLQHGILYAFDLYFCERRNAGSTFILSNNFLLDCSTRDYCGVCNGFGDCCQNSMCTNGNSNKCLINGKCPSPNRYVVDLQYIAHYCTYDTINYSYLNDRCTTYSCNPGTGGAVPKSVCPDKPCSNKSCSENLGCTYVSTCQPENSCRTAQCDATGECIRNAKNCSLGTDKCKNYYCNETNPNGCTSTPKCSEYVIINNTINQCKYHTCDPKIGECIVNTIVNCSACHGEPGKCELRDYCNAETGKWTFKQKVIDDGNPCTLDSCNNDTGVINNPFSCPGCTECDTSSGNMSCRIENLKCQGLNSSVCTFDICISDGSCEYPNIPCPAPKDKCEFYTCDPYIGCLRQSVDCPLNPDKCKESFCHPLQGCISRDRNCSTGVPCIDGICQAGYGCKNITRVCTPHRPVCQYGTCNNVTGECESTDYDPYPFECRTEAVISIGVIAGVIISGAVFLSIAVYSGKRLVDHLQERQKIKKATNNPIYQPKPGTKDNPLYGDTLK
ncbi:PA14 domain-containing protein [Cavenderia fasciculata]|uniref:PA14 domain-containing protein n=1 Tax=Cavenderia fasciculata TaxID=261658 RepID=F4PH11_CACFS|nr:PA14 domain-containing protein [Cavenderia fasciculata]EGG24995.1 PA14 domain-containing protein [Cavenderia fasciculata]|eukprot:XP_004362846.1 PA14 domain-containing protein [Cavenderia fasciculata]